MFSVIQFVEPKQIDWSQYKRPTLEEWASIPSWLRWGLQMNARWINDEYLVLANPGSAEWACLRQDKRSVWGWSVISWYSPEIQDILGAIIVMQRMVNGKDHR